MTTRPGVVCLLLLALCGCNVFAPKQEYRDYRAVRLTQDDSQRLLAMQRYVARHPDGYWYDSLQRERAARDRGVFEAGKSNRAGLELYLAAFPDGEFAAQARSRLGAVALIEQRKLEETTRAEQLAEQRKLHEVELSRTWVNRFFAYWVKTLLSINGWGSPIEQVARGNAEFSRAFGRPPRPRCTADECVKFYESSFGVPVPGGTRVERAMRLLLRLRMEEGRLVRAELLLPALGFSRWYELEERRVIVDGDSDARNKAVQWAIAHALPLLDTLAAQREPLTGYSLAEITAPAIASSGELLDTTAEDPSAPANHIQGTAAEEATVAELVKPVAPEQAADMEMATLHVGVDGKNLGGGGEMVLDPVAVPPATRGPSDMVLAPLSVPAAGQEPAPGAVPSPEGSAAVAALPLEPPEPASPAVTQAFVSGGLRIVVFAAASDARAPAYDGFVIERVPEVSAAAAKPRTPKPSSARPAKPKGSAAPTVPTHH